MTPEYSQEDSIKVAPLCLRAGNLGWVGFGSHGVNLGGAFLALRLKVQLSGSLALVCVFVSGTISIELSVS